MTALWTNAAEMGRCAGRNMAGRPTAYGGTFGILNATQVAEMPFVSMGIVHTADTDYETHVFQAADTYRKLVFTADGERLVGAVFVGDIGRAGLYRHLIRDHTPLSWGAKAIMERAPRLSFAMVRPPVAGRAMIRRVSGDARGRRSGLGVGRVLERVARRAALSTEAGADEAASG